MEKKNRVVSHLPLNALPAVQTWTANCKRDRKTVVTWHSQLCGFPWKPWWPYWSHSYVCVTIARRLDMSKFTKGIWQITFTVNIERAVRTWKPSFWIEKYFERIPSRPERVCKFADLFSNVSSNSCRCNAYGCQRQNKSGNHDIHGQKNLHTCSYSDPRISENTKKT